MEQRTTADRLERINNLIQENISSKHDESIAKYLSTLYNEKEFLMEADRRNWYSHDHNSSDKKINQIAEINQEINLLENTFEEGKLDEDVIILDAYEALDKTHRENVGLKFKSAKIYDKPSKPVEIQINSTTTETNRNENDKDEKPKGDATSNKDQQEIHKETPRSETVRQRESDSIKVEDITPGNKTDRDKAKNSNTNEDEKQEIEDDETDDEDLPLRELVKRRKRKSMQALDSTIKDFGQFPEKDGSKKAELKPKGSKASNQFDMHHVNESTKSKSITREQDKVKKETIQDPSE